MSLVFLGGSLVGFLTAARVLRRFVVRPRLALHRSRWWPLIKAGAPIGVATLLLTVLVKVDQVLISFLSGGDNREVGLYGAAFRLVEATMFISWAFTAAFLPWAARQSPATTARLARGYELGNKALAAVLIPVGITFAVLAVPLIDLFYGTSTRKPSAAALAGHHDRLLRPQPARRHHPGGPRPATRLCPHLRGRGGAQSRAEPRADPTAGGHRRRTCGGGLVGGPGRPGRLADRGLTGRVRLVRAFLGPVVAGAAMAGAMLASPLVPAALLGVVVYAGVLALFEQRVLPRMWPSCASSSEAADGRARSPRCPRSRRVTDGRIPPLFVAPFGELGGSEMVMLRVIRALD